MNKDNWVIVITAYLNYCTSENKIKQRDLDEYFMLNNSFNSLFQASKEYDVKVVIDMIIAIKELIINYELLSSEFFDLLLEYLNIIYTINFNRLHLLWKNIFDIFLNLIENNKNIVLRFALEFLTFITDYTMQEYIKADLPFKKTVVENLEKCILLINISINKKVNFIYLGLFGILEKMIDNSGNEIPIQYWKILLDKVYMILEFFYNKNEVSEELCVKVFDLIQKLNANYLKLLDVGCLSTFISILKLFMKLTTKRNYRYAIIEYFYTISDIVSKRFVGNIDLWIQLFSFLDINSDEKDGEIRNTALNIFAGIITNHGNEFSTEIWQCIMEDIYLRSFDNIIEIYFHLLREELQSTNMPDTPDFVIQLKNDYAKDTKAKKKDTRLKMITKEDLETVSLQWQETVKVLIMTFNRIISRYLAYPERDKEIVNKMFEKSFYLFRITSKNIFNEVTSVIEILLKSDAISKSKKVTLFLEIEKWMKRNKNQSQAVHDIMGIVKTIFGDKEFLEDVNNFSIILKIYSQIAYYSSSADEYSTYFYNLNLMCKAFMADLINFVLIRSEEKEDYLDAFLKDFNKIIKTDAVNEKANQTSLDLFSSLMESLSDKIGNIKLVVLQKVLDKLFDTNQLVFEENYQKMIKNDKKTIYYSFYESLNSIVDSFIQKQSNDTLTVFLDIMLDKFIIINKIGEIKKINKLTGILHLEYKLTTKVIYYFLDAFKEKFNEFKDVVDKVFIYNKVFKHNLILIEKKFGHDIEKDVESDRKISNLVNNYLKSYLKSNCRSTFKEKALKILAVNLDFNYQQIKERDKFSIEWVNKFVCQ